jgi:hypothetical protein
LKKVNINWTIENIVKISLEFYVIFVQVIQL